MLRRLVSLFLVSFLLYSFLLSEPALAKSKAEKEAAFTEKVRTGIGTLGSGEETRVDVKLRNKKRVVGYVSVISGHSFVVTDLKTGKATEVAYADVARVRGNNLSTGAKIAIGIAIGAAIVVIIVLIMVGTAF